MDHTKKNMMPLNKKWPDWKFNLIILSTKLSNKQNNMTNYHNIVTNSSRILANWNIKIKN